MCGCKSSHNSLAKITTCKHNYFLSKFFTSYNRLTDYSSVGRVKNTVPCMFAWMCINFTDTLYSAFIAESTKRSIVS